MIEGRDFAAASTVGSRERQEDDWGTHANPPAQEAGAGLLAVVADGMGGMPAGDRASAIALRAFLDSYPALQLPARERLRRALAHANREVGIAIEGDPVLAGMGCTLVAALFFSDRCEWLSIGDSFLLLCRDGRLERINPLHVYARELDERVRRGEITAEEAARDPDRAALTSVVQGTVLDEVAQGELALAPGDVVILASDGIATLSDDRIASICVEHGEESAGRIGETLIGQVDAAARPSQDNATVIVVRCAAETEADTLVVTQRGDEEAGTGEDDSQAEDRQAAHAPPSEAAGASREAPEVDAAEPISGQAEPCAPRSPARGPWGQLLLAFVLGALVGVVVWQALA